MEGGEGRRSVSWQGVLPWKILRWCTLLSFEMHSIWDNVIVSYSFIETSSDQKELNFAVERSGSIFQKNNRHVVGVNNRIRMEGEKIEFQNPRKAIFWNSGKMFASLQIPSTSSTAHPDGRLIFGRTAETTLFPLISVSDCWD